MTFSISNFPNNIQENIDNRENLLEFYNLQGEAYQVFCQNLTWLIDKRLSSDLEKQAPWSDPITEFEGVTTTLYGITIILEQWGNLKKYPIKHVNSKNFLELIANDICYIYSGTRSQDEQRKRFKRNSLSLQSRLKKNIQAIDTSLEPFIDSLRKDDIGIETLSLHIRLLIVILQIFDSDSDSDSDTNINYLINSIRNVWPNVQKDSKVLLDLFINLILDIAEKHGNFPIVFNIKSNKGINENSYSTYLVVKSIERILSNKALSKEYYNKIEIILQKISLKTIKILDNDPNIEYEKEFDYPFDFLSTDIYSLTLINFIEAKISPSFPSIKLSIQDKKIVETFNNRLIDELGKNINKEILNNGNNITAKIQVEKGVYFITDMDFTVIENIIFLLTEENTNSQTIKWSDKWKLLIKYIMKLINSYSSKNKNIGFIMDSPYEDNLRTVSIIATIRSLETLSEFGLDASATAGIVDILDELLIELKINVVREFYNKFSDLELKGYRLAWKKIQEDYKNISTIHLEDRNLQSNKEISQIRSDCSGEYLLSVMAQIRTLHVELFLSDEQIIEIISREKINHITQRTDDIVEEIKNINKYLSSYFISILSSQTVTEMEDCKKTLISTLTSEKRKKLLVNKHSFFIRNLQQLVIDNTSDVCLYLSSIRDILERIDS